MPDRVRVPSQRETMSNAVALSSRMPSGYRITGLPVAASSRSMQWPARAGRASRLGVACIRGMAECDGIKDGPQQFTFEPQRRHGCLLQFAAGAMRERDLKSFTGVASSLR